MAQAQFALMKLAINTSSLLRSAKQPSLLRLRKPTVSHYEQQSTEAKLREQVQWDDDIWPQWTGMAWPYSGGRSMAVANSKDGDQRPDQASAVFLSAE